MIRARTIAPLLGLLIAAAPLCAALAAVSGEGSRVEASHASDSAAALGPNAAGAQAEVAGADAASIDMANAAGALASIGHLDPFEAASPVSSVNKNWRVYE